MLWMQPSQTFSVFCFIMDKWFVCMCEYQPSFASPLIHLPPNCSGFNQEVSRSKTCAGEDSNPEMGQIQSTCKRMWTGDYLHKNLTVWVLGFFWWRSLFCVCFSCCRAVMCHRRTNFPLCSAKAAQLRKGRETPATGLNMKDFLFFFSFALERDSAQDCSWSLVDALLGKTSVSVWAKAAETSHTSNCS